MDITVNGLESLGRTASTVSKELSKEYGCWRIY